MEDMVGIVGENYRGLPLLELTWPEREDTK